MAVAEPLEQQPLLTVGQQLQGKRSALTSHFRRGPGQLLGLVFLSHFVWLLASATDVPILSLHPGANAWGLVALSLAGY